MLKKIIALGAVCAFALALAGCGSGGGAIEDDSLGEPTVSMDSEGVAPVNPDSLAFIVGDESLGTSVVLANGIENGVTDIRLTGTDGTPVSLFPMGDILQPGQSVRVYYNAANAPFIVSIVCGDMSYDVPDVDLPSMESATFVLEQGTMVLR